MSRCRPSTVLQHPGSTTISVEISISTASEKSLQRLSLKEEVLAVADRRIALGVGHSHGFGLAKDSRRPLQGYGEGEAVLIGGQKGALLNEERLFGRPRSCSRLATWSGCSSLSAPRAPFASGSEITIMLVACHLTKGVKATALAVPAGCQIPAKFSSHRNARGVTCRRPQNVHSSVRYEDIAGDCPDDPHGSVKVQRATTTGGIVMSTGCRNGKHNLPLS